MLFRSYPYAFVHAKDTSGKTVTLTYSYGWNGRYKQKFEITVKKHEVKAYFYVQRPGMDPDSLENKDWKYVGYGNIDVSGIKNQHGTLVRASHSLDTLRIYVPSAEPIFHSVHCLYIIIYFFRRCFVSDTYIMTLITDLSWVNFNDIDVEILY